MINPKTTETMKTQNEKLQFQLDFIRERSKENLKQAAFLKDIHKGEGLYIRGLCKGYGDAFALTAKWIQEIIDYDLQNKNESINN